MDEYSRLSGVFQAALEQASEGKGKARHANKGERFEDQQIVEIAMRLSGNPAAGPLFQAVKKIYESGRFDNSGAAVNELYGAIVYIAAAIIVMEDMA